MIPIYEQPAKPPSAEATSEHAPIGPSAFHQYAACPGSFDPESHKKSDTGSQAAREGTCAHWLLEDLLKDQALIVGEAHPNGVVIDTEMFSIITGCLPLIDDIPGEYLLAESRLEVGAGYHFMGILQEWRTSWSDSLKSALWGTGDVTIIDPEAQIITMVDLKYGYYPVDPKHNIQLLNYLIGVIGNSEKLSKMPGMEGFDPTQWKFRGGILQPRLKNEIQFSQMYTYAELRAEAMLFAGNIIAFTEENRPRPREAGDSQCRFCQYSGNCAPQAAYALRDFEDLDTPEGLKEAEESLDNLGALDAAALSALLDKKDFILRFYEALTKHALLRLSLDISVPGWGHRNRKGALKWALTDAAFEQAVKRIRVPLKRLLKKPEYMTPTQCMSELRDHPNVAKLQDLAVRGAPTQMLVKHNHLAEK